MYSNIGGKLLAPKLAIVRMIIRETGTYNQQYLRPYELDTSDGRADRMMSRIERSPVIDGNLIAGVSGDLISQSRYAEGRINIPNGWDTRRLSFFLEVEQTNTTGSSTVYIFQGYSDHADFSMSGEIDPRTEFFINSYIALNRSYNRITGQVNDVVVEAANVISGRYIKTYENHDQLYAMRPEDLVTGIESQHLEDTYSQYSKGAFNDTRIGMGSDTIMSRRRNNLASTYLANTLSSFRQSSSLGDFGMRQSDFLGAAANFLIEPTPGDVNFIRALSNVQRRVGTTSFTLPELADVDTSLRSEQEQQRRIQIIALGNVEKNKLHRAGQTADWEDAKISQWAATVFINSLSAIMMELYITKIAISCTNSASGGRVDIRVMFADSLMQIDLAPQVQTLKARLEHEILRDISNNNQEIYYIRGDIDLFNESSVSIEIAGAPEMDFCCPSFSDSIIMPTMTTSRDRLNNIFSDVEELSGMITEASRGPSGISVSHNL